MKHSYDMFKLFAYILGGLVALYILNAVMDAIEDLMNTWLIYPIMIVTLVFGFRAMMNSNSKQS